MLKKLYTFLSKNFINIILIIWVIASAGIFYAFIFYFILNEEMLIIWEFIFKYFDKILSVISIIVAFLAFIYSQKASNNSEEIIHTFLRQITNFNEVANTVIEEFLSDVENSEIKMSLISPAFSALSNKPEQFDTFNKHLFKVGRENKKNNFKIIIVTEYRLFRWYKNLIEVMDYDNDQKIKMINDLISRLKQIKKTMLDLIIQKNCSIMKRIITFQIFLLEKKSLRKALHLNLHSDFPTKVPYMINKKNASYTEISDMSSGFYSRAKKVYKDQNAIFDNCWEHQNSPKSSCMDETEINSYFDFVIQRLKTYSSQLNKNIEKKNSK